MSSVQTKEGKAISKREKKDCYNSFIYTHVHVYTMDSVLLFSDHQTY